MIFDCFHEVLYTPELGFFVPFAESSVISFDFGYGGHFHDSD